MPGRSTTSTSPRPALCRPIPGSNVNCSAAVQGIRRHSGRRERGEFHVQLLPAFLGRGASPTVRASALAYTLSKSMDNGSNYRDIVPDTYNTSNLWGPSEYDTRHVVIDQLYLRICRSSRRSMTGSCSAAGRSPAPRSSRPARPAASAPTTISRASAKFGSFGCGTEGQFWISERHPSTSTTGAFAGPTGNASSVPEVLHGQRLRSRPPALSICSRACATRSTARASRIGTSRCSRHSPSTSARIPVPRRGVRLHQSSEPERPEPEPHFQPVRRDHQQDRSGANAAAFAAVRFLRQGSLVVAARNEPIPGRDVLRRRPLHIVNSAAISSIPSHRFCRRRFSL